MGEGGQRYRFPALKWLSLADVVYGTVTVVNIVVRCVILHCILKRGGGRWRTLKILIVRKKVCNYVC